MEELAEAWSLSLDESLMAEVKHRLVSKPRLASEIRDWRAVFDELGPDAEVHG